MERWKERPALKVRLVKNERLNEKWKERPGLKVRLVKTERLNERLERELEEALQKLGRSGGKSKGGRRRLVERWWRYWHIQLGKWHWKVFGGESL